MLANNQDFFETLNSNQKQHWVRGVISSNVFAWIDNLFLILFPEVAIEVSQLKSLWLENKTDLFLILSKINPEKSEVEILKITESIYSEIPEIYQNLQLDAKAMLNTDPAADCISEIINSYPGFLAIAFYRIAHTIDANNVRMIPRIIAEYAHSKTGIDIHPKATIGVPFVIDHGTGVVIGETAVIGKNVSIYQGVTLGALQVEKSMKEKKRHPTLEDNVVIYANATILGGSTIIGNHSVIGGNTFVTKSVNPYSMVMQSSKNNIINDINSLDINIFSI